MNTTNPTPSEARQTPTRMDKEFDKYWTALNHAMVPGRHYERLAKGAFSNGWLGGEFWGNTGSTEQRDQLLARIAALERALRSIANWNGDCIDHPDTIGTPNPKEQAQTALTP